VTRFTESDHGVTAVKNRYLNGARAAFTISLSRALLTPRAKGRGLALSEFRRYISPAFPDKACGGA